MKRRSLDPGLVLAGWPAFEGEADPSFVDRVLAAYDAPVRVAPRRWPLYACAVVVASLFAPLLVASKSPGPSAAMSSAPDLDLGLQTD